ncbi:rare lipoprotein A [Pseudarcicella hirudinis]|uniref:Probable endolytic peptidoglycan transglycosylase RlpA n=1 Tax=Pseudarcicella hirudinis TaxID=1079859 RepID=A0A1I5RZV2_9BACT|nr:septal ring lytic transglycosylase RlpA family protein [Pseudarcicella hirudinis]SFP63811.1 rare lipoprotein A [Pseudarcicella hirudinis]
MKIFKTFSWVVPFLLLTLPTMAQIGEEFYGKASYYADYLHGKVTSNGERYQKDCYTAAHLDLPFNTFLEVTNTETGKMTIVKVNDRGPFVADRMIDLSYAAARDIDLLQSGIASVKIKIIGMDNPAYTIPNYTASQKGEFNLEFKQYAPVKVVMKEGRVLVVEEKEKSDSLIADVTKAPEASKEESIKHHFVKLTMDKDGRMRLDSTDIPDAETKFSPVAENTSKDKVSENQQVKEVGASAVSSENIHKSIRSSGKEPDSGQTFVKIYKENEGRVRADSTVLNKPR